MLARWTLDLSPLLEASLLLGWASMPVLLVLSLSRPRIRYALVLPSTLVGVPLLMICARDLPADRLAAAGWVAMTGGIVLGGVLGLWFWYRALPVPAALHDAFAPGRWALVALHVALVVGGVVAVTAAALG